MHKGYVYIRVNGKYEAEHRLIMERMLGRKLTNTEEVDHRNKIRDDNRPENLRLMASKSKHQQHHKPKGYHMGNLAVGWIDGRSLKKRKCKVCSKIFIPSSRKKGEGIYCSRKCGYISRRRPRSKCPVCGKPASRPTRKFCSAKCYSKWKKNKIQFTKLKSTEQYK